MTGGEHYAEAERLLDTSMKAMAENHAKGKPEHVSLTIDAHSIARAQVHALLAVAATNAGKWD